MIDREYRTKYKELTKIPDERISEIYIIPADDYNGFWGENGYRTFDFILGDKEIYGWVHWEGDVISLISGKDMRIDCKCENDYLRLYSFYNLKISDFELSNLTIESEVEE